MFFKDIVKSLNIKLPDETLEPLNRHFRLQEEVDFFLRVLSHEEIVEMLEFMSDLDGFQDLLPIWTDDNSNYVCMYYRGPLSYRVCYMNHEETDLSPGYRNVGTFIAALEPNPQSEWDDLEKDYPNAHPENSEWIAADLESIEQIHHILQNPDLEDEMRCQHIYSVLALTPHDHLDSLVQFLDEDDMFVQERACDILGYHQYAPARGKLREIAEHGLPNARSAAKRALARMG